MIHVCEVEFQTGATWEIWLHRTEKLEGESNFLGHQ